MILVKKAGDGSKKIKGCWDSIHVVEVQEKSSGRSAHYKLTSTSMLWLQTNKVGSGTMNLGGSLTRQVISRDKKHFYLGFVHRDAFAGFFNRLTIRGTRCHVKSHQDTIKSDP